MRFPFLTRAALLCALVCPAALHGADTFTVCWYNIANWGVTDRWVDGKKVKDTAKPADEQDAVVAMLKKHNPDVFAACEVLLDPADPEKNARDLRERLKAGGLEFKEMRTVRGEDTRGSLVLFSKFPIAKFEALNKDTFKVTKKTAKAPGSRTEEVELRVSRGLLHAVIQVTPSYSFDIFTAHLKSKRPADMFDDDKTQQKGDTVLRRNEALILRGHIMNTYKGRPDANILVVGDLNDTMNYPAIKNVVGYKNAEVRMHILPQADYLGDRWTHYYIPNCEYQKIDYMIASDGMAREYVAAESGVYREKPTDPKELKWTSGSDHRMLFATFQTKDSSEPYVPENESGD